MKGQTGLDLALLQLLGMLWMRETFLPLESRSYRWSGWGGLASSKEALEVELLNENNLQKAGTMIFLLWLYFFEQNGKSW